MKACTLKKIEAIIIVLLVALAAGFVYYIGDANVKGVVVFGMSGLVVMVYYYIEGWIRMSDRERLLDYLIFDNPLQAYDAIKRLVLLCAGSGLVGHFGNMDLEHIITAGAAVGYMAFTHKEEKKDGK